VLSVTIFPIHKLGDPQLLHRQQDPERRLHRDTHRADFGIKRIGVKLGIKKNAGVLGTVGPVPEHWAVRPCAALAVGEAFP